MRWHTAAALPKSARSFSSASPYTRLHGLRRRLHGLRRRQSPCSHVAQHVAAQGGLFLLVRLCSASSTGPLQIITPSHKKGLIDSARNTVTSRSYYIGQCDHEPRCDHHNVAAAVVFQALSACYDTVQGIQFRRRCRATGPAPWRRGSSKRSRVELAVVRCTHSSSSVPCNKVVYSRRLRRESPKNRSDDHTAVDVPRNEDHNAATCSPSRSAAPAHLYVAVARPFAAGGPAGPEPAACGIQSCSQKGSRGLYGCTATYHQCRKAAALTARALRSSGRRILRWCEHQRRTFMAARMTSLYVSCARGTKSPVPLRAYMLHLLCSLKAVVQASVRQRIHIYVVVYERVSASPSFTHTDSCLSEGPAPLQA